MDAQVDSPWSFFSHKIELGSIGTRIADKFTLLLISNHVQVYKTD